MTKRTEQKPKKARINFPIDKKLRKALGEKASINGMTARGLINLLIAGCVKGEIAVPRAT